jgi:hypothetical protein
VQRHPETGGVFCLVLIYIFNYMELKTISEQQLEQLNNVPASQAWTPCQVKLINGNVMENVYIANYELYKLSWGPFLPNENMLVQIENIIEIKASPNSLPVLFAKKLYDAGESGMGYCVFKILYDNGSTLNVVTGNAVDFVPSLEGLSIENIVDVLPHQGSTTDYTKGLEYKWCLYKIEQ